MARNYDEWLKKYFPVSLGYLGTAHIPTPYSIGNEWIKKRFIDKDSSLFKADYASIEKRIVDHYLRGDRMRTQFKGTRSTWYCSDGRVISVKNLDTAHLANVIEYLRSRAVEDLDFSCYAPIIYKEVDNWLNEYCITYPALKLEAETRGIWSQSKINIGPQETVQYVKYDKKLTLEKKVELLTDLVQELIKK